MLAVVDWVQSLMGWLMSITPTVLSGMLLVGLVWGGVASTRQVPEETGDKRL